jgi:4-amino-4-deoxy-L-arabinose transferase-like glycosyltransferase
LFPRPPEASAPSPSTASDADDSALASGDEIPSASEQPSREAADGPVRGRWKWHVGLLVIALVGLGLRIGYVYLYRHHASPTGDAYFYHYQANLLVSGKWFINPYDFGYFGTSVPAADHPPLWTLVLALASALGIKSFFGQILWSCVVGSIAVWLVGLAGRQVMGPRTGLIAAGIAALYPNFWISDGSLLSETLVLLLCALTVWAFFRLWNRPSLPRAGILGCACALGSLARSELVLLIPIFVIAAGLLVRGQRIPRRLLLFVVAAVAAAVTLVPWWAYNQSRFSDSEPLSSQLGVTLATANCKTTYYGKLLGYWSLDCATRIHTTKGADPSVQDREYREAAIHYAEHHESRLAAVVGARLGRELDFYRPRQQINLEWSVLGRPRLPAYIGMGVYYLCAVLAVVGAFVLRRRRIPVIPFLGLILVTVLVAAATFGQTRYRTALDAAIVLLAAVAIDRLFWRRDHRRRPRGSHAIGSSGI